ncbi:MAG: NAD(P)-binding protein [Chloroflexi bacterium]|nr:NAD(P)-binding protein [Chloroflexota bacterium]
MTQKIVTDVLIVGAGMAGLMAGRVLMNAGKRVLLVDKGRSVGGRMATRRLGGGVADHGAQFFTVREPEFRTWVERWLAEGLVFEWSRGWSDGSLADTSRDGHPRYAAYNGMNALAKHLARGLDVHTGVKLVAVQKIEGGWQVEDETGEKWQAKAVLLTPPVPQSLDLLDDGDVQLSSRDRAALDAIEYDPCLTVLLVLDRAAHLPKPGAIQRPYANLYWIDDNHVKGISPEATILTAQANPLYSRQFWDMSDEKVLAAFQVDLLPLLGDAQISEAQVKRWRYAQPANVYPERCLVVPYGDHPLVLAGDAFGGPRIEGAALSGLTAGRALLAGLSG